MKIICFLTLVLILIPYAGDNDFWFHLRIGQGLWDSKSLIQTEVFSFSAHGESWLNHEWPFQLGLFGIYSLAGFQSIAVIVAIVGAATLFLLRRGEVGISQVVLIGIVALAIRPFIVPRPQVLAYLALAALLFFLDRYIRSRSKKDLVFIAVTLWAWSNAHASVILALPILGTYALDFLFGSLKSLPKENKKEFFIACFFGLLLTLFNPLFYDVYTQALQPFKYSKVYETLIETKPLVGHLGNFSGNFIFGVHLALGAMLVWLFVRRQADGWRAYLLGSLFWIAPLTSIKYIPFSWMVIIPIILHILPKWEIGKVFRIVTASVVILAGALMFVGKIGGVVTNVHKEWPRDLVEFMDEQKIEGRLFNPLSWGGYLMWNSPERPVFIWGGCDCFYDQQYFEAIDFGKGERVDETITKYNFDIVLVRPWESLAYVMSEKTDWALVYWDNFGMIFLRRGGKNDETIKKYSLNIPYINDTIEATLRKVPKNRIHQLIQNYEEAIKRRPDLTLGRLRIGMLYQALGRCDLAIPQWQSILRYQNDLGIAHQKLAECYRTENNLALYKKEVEMAAKYKNHSVLWLGRP